MQHLALICLLLYGFIHTAPTAVYHVEFVENSIAILKCGDLTEGKVTWSGDINGQKKDLLTSHNGEVTKHIPDPHKRYSSGANVVLIISRVSLSDAGKYYCSGSTVELQVIPKTVYHVEIAENNITLKCGNLTEGKVTWSRDINGQKKDLLTSNNGEVSKHISDPHDRYSSEANVVLIITRVSLSDAGKYYCSGNTVELQVIPRSSPTSATTRTTGVVTSATTRTTDTMVTVVSLSVGFGLLSLVLVSLLLWRCCILTKSAKASKSAHVYESVKYIATSTGPACVKQCGGIYVLAGDPAVLNLVKKNQSLPLQNKIIKETDGADVLHHPNK